MKRSLYSIGFILLYLSFTDVKSQTVFNRLYDNNFLYDASFSTIQTTDGNFLIGGSTSDLFSTYYAALLIKANSSGDTIWQKKYDFSPTGGDYIISVLQKNNNRYIACGMSMDTIPTNNRDIFIMELDTAGNIIWVNMLGTSDNEFPQSIKKTLDGGYIIAGYTSPLPSGYLYSFLMKTDNAGNFQWQKQYGGSLDDAFNNVIQLSDSGFVAAGGIAISPTDIDLYVVRTNSNGDTLWTKRYGNSPDDGALDIRQTLDGGFVIAGSKKVAGEDNAYVIKTDVNGAIQWEKNFGTVINQELFYRIYQLSDGSYMAGGAIYLYDQSPAYNVGLLMKLNTTGDSVWSKTYTSYGSPFDSYLYDMKPTSDGGYVMCGMIINNTLPQKNDVWLVKTDSLGCDSVGCLTSVGEIPFINNISAIVYPNPLITSATFEINGISGFGYIFVLYDAFGREVQIFTIQDSKFIFESKNLMSGVYFYSIQDKNFREMVRGKLIIVNK